VEALVSPVGVHRASFQGSSWLYVNGRFVKDPLLRRAVTLAYQSIVPKDRYPVVVLEVRIPGEEVDVNAHPAKTERGHRDAELAAREIGFDIPHHSL
jgi:DNA mismatch repair protein MutL